MINPNIGSTKTAIRVFLPWQDEKEEIWLERMAAQGWQIESVVPFSYSFRKVEPNNSSIRLDYKNTWSKDYQDYLAIFRDSGWKLLTTMGNWHYFMIETRNDTIPEIYNSNRTKAQKYSRVLLGLAPLILLIISPLTHALDLINIRQLDGLDIALRLFYVFVALLFIYSFLRVCIKLIRLNNNHLE